MEGINLVVLAGNVCADPVLRKTSNGVSVLSIRIATTERIERAGVWEDRSEFHAVAVWGRRAEGLARWIRKGDPLSITGTLRTSKYTDQAGVERWRTSVHADRVVLSGGRRSGGLRRDDDPGPGDDLHAGADDPEHGDAFEGAP